MKYVPIGNSLPVQVQMGEGLTNLFVRAWLLAVDGTELAQVDLTHRGNGLYTDTSLVMPNAQFAFIQAVAYTDSLYTVPYDGNVSTMLVTSTPSLDVGVSIPAWAQLGLADNIYFPLATILAADGSEISGSPFALVFAVRGLYVSNVGVMPVTAYVSVQVEVYSDSGHTMEADFYISALSYPGDPDGSVVPACPDPALTVDGFKAWFWRDFPYGVTLDTVTNQDIQKALNQAVCFVNPQLFCNDGSKNMNTLLLAAHFLVMNLRASSQGLSGQFSWLQTSKSVGSVSESYQIPDRIMENPELAMLTKTGYGAEFLFNILPALTGQVFVVLGRTLP